MEPDRCFGLRRHADTDSDTGSHADTGAYSGTNADTYSGTYSDAHTHTYSYRWVSGWFVLRAVGRVCPRLRSGGHGFQRLCGEDDVRQLLVR